MKSYVIPLNYAVVELSTRNVELLEKLKLTNKSQTLGRGVENRACGRPSSCQDDGARDAFRHVTDASGAFRAARDCHHACLYAPMPVCTPTGPDDETQI